MSQVNERPEEIEPVYTHPNSKREYFITAQQRGRGGGAVFYRLVAAEHIDNWDEVQSRIPNGYYVDVPRRGKPLLKRG